MPANKTPLGDNSCLQGSSVISGKVEEDTFTGVKLLLQWENLYPVFTKKGKAESSF